MSDRAQHFLASCRCCPCAISSRKDVQVSSLSPGLSYQVISCKCTPGIVQFGFQGHPVQSRHPPSCLRAQAENDIQQALDLLSSPMCNAALQQALVASSVETQGPSVPSGLPPALRQSHAAHASGVGMGIFNGVVRCLEAPTLGN